MTAIRRSVDAPVEFGQLFGYYGMIVPILGVTILQMLGVYIGMLLLILPGLYLALATSLAIPLKVEKDLGVVDSLVTSVKLVNTRFLNVFALFLIAGIGLVLASFTIVGVIWALPWTMMVYAITYRQLAGVDLETADTIHA